MAGKPNWGAGLRSLGGSLRQYAMMQRQDAMLQEEREYQARLLKDKNALWDTRYDQRLEDTRETYDMQHPADPLDASHVMPFEVEGGRFNPVNMMTEGIRNDPAMAGLIDMQNEGIVPTKRQFLAAQGEGQKALRESMDAEAAVIETARVKDEDSARLLKRQKEYAEWRSDHEPPKKADEPQTLGDSLALRTTVSKGTRGLYPERENLVATTFGKLLGTKNLETGKFYRKSQATWDLASAMARALSTATPHFGDESYDPATKKMYDPSVYETDSNKHALWWDGDPSIDMKEGLDDKGKEWAEFYPPASLVDYFNDKILPHVIKDEVTFTKIRQWAKANGVSDTRINQLITDAGKQEIVLPTTEPSDDGLIWDPDADSSLLGN